MIHIVLRRQLLQSHLCITEIAYESKYHHAICSSGASLPVVCEVLRQTSTEDVYQNVFCLFSLICARDCEEARDIIRKGKGLEPVRKTLQSVACRENQGLIQMVTEALHKTAISPANCEVYKSHGAINLVLDRWHQGVSDSIVLVVYNNHSRLLG